MADYNATIAPFINNTFYVTSYFGVQPTRTHRGLDIATPTGSPLYSLFAGVVIQNSWDNSYGWYIIIKSHVGIGSLYAHMREKSPLFVGQQIAQGQYVGHEGSTGNSTGIHLHVELQDISNNNWIYGLPIDDYINPATYMGFPNTNGISVYYDGVPINPSPTERKKSKFKWLLFKKRKFIS